VEPDIYLHSDLQRQLLGILRNLGPDILIATHSTEIITEAESDDIVLIDKNRRCSKRIRQPSELTDVFMVLGSNLNPTLTQLAKTKRVVFVEGKDFQIFAKFARKLGFNDVSNRSKFAVVPSAGFNPDRIRNLKMGMETTLGEKINAIVILDKDFRSNGERLSVGEECEAFSDHAFIHNCKEIENFLLIPEALDRAACRKVTDQVNRSGKDMVYSPCASQLLNDFSNDIKTYVQGQFVENRLRFERSSGEADSVITELALKEFEQCWEDQTGRLMVIPGKEALRHINQSLQQNYGISLTPTSIIDAMKTDEIPDEINQLIRTIAAFSQPV